MRTGTHLQGVLSTVSSTLPRTSGGFVTSISIYNENDREAEPLIEIQAPGQSWLLSTLDLPYLSEYRMLPYLGQSPVLPEHLQVRLLHYRVLHIHEGLQNGKMETFFVSGKLHTHDHPPKNSLTLTSRP